MAPMDSMAVYRGMTDPRRHKTYPFAAGQTPPRQIVCDDTDEVFQLIAVHYEGEPSALDEQAARVRAWNARHVPSRREVA